MNLADTSGNSFIDARLPAVFADPATIEDSKWKRVRIECRDANSDLSGVRFIRCKVTDSYIGNAKLHLEGAVFEDCEFTTVTFMYGRLRGATFRRSKLVDCLLRAADLRDSRFEDCEIVSTDFAKADFSSSVFERTELLRMEHWGWQPFDGAQLDDAQRFKHFIASDIWTALSSVSIPPERLAGFIVSLESSGFGGGEAMFLYDEWRDTISFEDFVAVGKAATQGLGEQASGLKRVPR